MPFYEIGTAFLCSSLISPVMMVMDTAIIKSQFENIPIRKSYYDTFYGYWNRSIPFKRPLQIMNHVYFSTYATANLTELYCKSNHIDHKLPTFFFTSLVNIAGVLYKDRSYIRMFEKTVLDIPFRSYVLFAFRDSMTVGSTFVIKKDFVHSLHIDHQLSYPVADFIASFTLPIIAQVFSTPLHILGMDYYQRPRVLLSSRLHHIHNLYISICTGRMLRILPAFCFGSFLNDMLRSKRYFDDE